MFNVAYQHYSIVVPGVERGNATSICFHTQCQKRVSINSNCDSNLVISHFLVILLYKLIKLMPNVFQVTNLWDAFLYLKYLLTWKKNVDEMSTCVCPAKVDLREISNINILREFYPDYDSRNFCFDILEYFSSYSS